MPAPTVQELIDAIDNTQIRNLMNLGYKDMAPVLAKLEEDILKGVLQFGSELDGKHKEEFLTYFRKEAFHTMLKELDKMVKTQLAKTEPI